MSFHFSLDDDNKGVNGFGSFRMYQGVRISENIERLNLTNPRAI